MPEKIMVVDDDKELLGLIREMLKAHGYNVTTFESGELALQAIDAKTEDSKFDVIFLDLMMPGLSGFKVIEELKKRPHASEIPVIMLTARDSGMDMISGYQAGANYYLPKPFTRSQLVYGVNLVVHGEEEAKAASGEAEGTQNLEDWFEGRNR